MKRYEFAIDRYQAEWIFSPVRSRRDIISLLMKTIKIMLVNSVLDEQTSVGKVVLVVSKMSRLFYISETKVFTITFPFFVNKVGDNYSFKSHAHSDVNSKVSSDILALLDADGIFETMEVLNFAEPISDACKYDVELWALFRELLMAEDGYLRYDHDDVRVDAHKHPLNHLDVFYTNSSSFKIGLIDRINEAHLTDILDANSDCHYLAPFQVKR
jgi:hypothetical protein